jgi:hypothetical protein
VLENFHFVVSSPIRGAQKTRLDRAQLSGVPDLKSAQKQERYRILPGRTRYGQLVDQNFQNVFRRNLELVEVPCKFGVQCCEAGTKRSLRVSGVHANPRHVCLCAARSKVAAVLIGSMEWRTARYVIGLRDRVDVNHDCLRRGNVAHHPEGGAKYVGGRSAVRCDPSLPT